MTGLWLIVTLTGAPPRELPSALDTLDSGYCGALPAGAALTCEAPAEAVLDRCEFYAEDACRRSSVSLGCRTPDGDAHGETWVYGAARPVVRTYRAGVRHGPSVEVPLSAQVARPLSPQCEVEPRWPAGCGTVHATYRDGLLHGPWSCDHDASDAPFLEGRYDAGVRDGRWTWRARDGHVLGETTYAPTGRRLERTWCPDGSVASEGTLDGGLRSGPYTEHACEPRPERRCDDLRATYRAGILHGSWTCTRDGAVTLEGRFDLGRPAGRWVFHSSGRPVGARVMRDGAFVERCADGRELESSLRSSLSPCYPEEDPE